jgi:fatty-acyl-CoA synthase
MPEWRTPDPVALHACSQPGRLACVDLATGRTWTYRQLDDAINQAADYLIGSCNIRPGDRIATVARNSADLVILQQALMRIEAMFVPVNWRLSVPEQERILADCRPAMLLVDRFAPSLAMPENCRLLTVDDFIGGVASVSSAVRRPAAPADTPIVILYTSGTSGHPKGVLLTGRNIFATAVNFCVLGHVSNDSVFLCDTPMFHVIGLVTSIQAPLLQGGAVLISAGFDPLITNDRLADEALAVSHYFCVPQMAQALRLAANFAPERWKRLKALFTGGAPNPPANIRWWLSQGVRMVDGYGMTEAGTLLGMSLDLERIDRKAGSSGLPPPGLTLRIADDEGRDVAVGEVGEILVAGPNVTSGYWERPDETAKAFTADGWLRTGDLGRRDEDGFITVVDRRKDMFISGGENVYPVEVEAALIEHPAVGEVAVIGIPDAQWGEVGRAFIVFKPGCSAAPQDFAAHCSSLIARYKVPKDFVFVERLPRSAAGKVLKNELKVVRAG